MPLTALSQPIDFLAGWVVPTAGTLPGVTRDATSGVYCPANAAEWAIVLTAAGITSGGPSLCWNLQESSGGAADSIGTFSSSVSGAVLYRQAVVGWSRVGFAGGDGVTAEISGGSTGLPDLSTTSCLSLGYRILASTPAALRTIEQIGNVPQMQEQFTAAAKYQLNSAGNVATGAANPVGAVRPYGILSDVTNNKAVGWTDQEILGVTRGAPSGNRLKMFFGYPGVDLYQVAFFGSAAELTNAQIGILLRTLGWSLSWLAGVTRDATSGIYCPANAAEWTIVMAAAGITSGGPSLCWNLQEASGAVVDSIGTFTTTPTGTPITYRTPVTGWSRFGIAGADGGTGTAANVAAGLPDMATTSCLLLGYATLTSALTVGSTAFLLGSSPNATIAFNSGAGTLFGIGSGATSANGTANPVGGVRPYGMIYDVTNNRMAGWSDQEIVPIARGGTVIGKRFRIIFTFPGAHLYTVGFFGAAAELTNPQIKTLCQTLGWSIPWTAPTTTTLTVGITDSTDPVISTVNFTYAVIVTNTGYLPATSVSATITLDASLTYVSAVGTGWTVGVVGQVVTCTRATLVPGAAPTITVTVTTANAASTATTTANAIAGNAAAATQATQTTVVKLVDRDATSLVRCPSSATQWAAFTAYHVAIGTANFPNVAPSLLWNMQEASGNVADSIGTFTGTTTGTPLTYRQAVAGWSRLGVTGGDGGAGQFYNNAAGLPDAATTSFLTIGYSILNSAPSAPRSFSIIGVSAYTYLAFHNTIKFQVYSGASIATGTANPIGAVRPYGMLYDVTNNRVAGWSDQEILAVAKGATTGKYFQEFLFFPGALLYRVAFFGAAAEITNAQIKALLVALGWSIPW